MSVHDSDDSSARRSWRRLQLRSLVGEYLAVIAVVVVLVALAGSVLTYNTHVDPGTETTTVEESSWSSTGQYAHEATVTEQSPVFDRGTVLADRPFYLESVTPALDGQFVYGYEASDGGNLDGAVDVTLVYRSVNGDGVEFWRDERELRSRSLSSLAPGEQVRVPFSVNVTAARLEMAAIEEQLGPTPGNTEIIVESSLRADGQRNGDPVTVERSYQLSIRPNSGIYGVDDPGPVENGDRQVGQTVTTASYGPLRGTLPPLLLVASLLVAAGLVVALSRGELALSDREREWLDYQQDRAGFTEWISTGSVPEEARSKTRIELDSLGGLVDVAIDSDRRVIEDDEQDAYYVVDSVVYVFERPEPPGGVDPLDPDEGTDPAEADDE